MGSAIAAVCRYANLRVARSVLKSVPGGEVGAVVIQGSQSRYPAASGNSFLVHK